LPPGFIRIFQIAFLPFHIFAVETGYPHGGPKHDVKADRCGHVLKNTVLDCLCESRGWFDTQFWKAYGVKWLRSEVKPRCPSHLVLPIDMIHILARVVLHLPLRQMQEVLPLSKRNSFFRANLGTGRKTALIDLFETEVALSNLRGEGVAILICGDLKGAGNHTVAAADTLAGIVDNGSVLFLAQCPYNAGRGAGGIVAMHALEFYKGRSLFPCEGADAPRIVLVDHCIRYLIRAPGTLEDRHFIERLMGAGKAVPLVARLLTRPATDAKGGVDQAAESCCRRSMRPGSMGRFPSACKGRDGKSA